jgi:hypothetical protein
LCFCRRHVEQDAESLRLSISEEPFAWAVRVSPATGMGDRRSCNEVGKWIKAKNDMICASRPAADSAVPGHGVERATYEYTTQASLTGSLADPSFCIHVRGIPAHSAIRDRSAARCDFGASQTHQAALGIRQSDMRPTEAPYLGDWPRQRQSSLPLFLVVCLALICAWPPNEQGRAQQDRFSSHLWTCCWDRSARDSDTAHSDTAIKAGNTVTAIDQ